MKSRLVYTMLCAGLLAAATSAPARTKLVTLPDRQTTVVSLENPSHALLYEEREIPLQKGGNLVDFAWNGVSIDQGSVMIEFLTHPGTGPDATKIIATGYPANEQALTWQVYSPEARTETVRVSYLLQGISTEDSYDFRANEAETGGDFRHYVLLRNRSGENLDNAVLRFPTGEDQTRSVDSGEARRFTAQRASELPVKKLYVVRPDVNFRANLEDPETINMVYELENSAASGLGKGKLPAGKLRIYGDDGMESSIFLGEDTLKETAPGEKGELALGTVRDVVIRRRLISDRQTNQRQNLSRRVVLYDQERHLRYEVENFKNEPVTLRIHETLSGDWSVVELSDKGAKTERKSSNELLITIDLPANTKGEVAEKKVVDLKLLVKNRFPGES